MAPLARKYTRAALYDFLLAPHTARPQRRMPDLRLAPAEAHALLHYLLATKAPTASATTDRADQRTDAERIAAGRAEFAARGCVHCHPLADPLRAASPLPKPLAALDPTRGCLSDSDGAWPRYALSCRPGQPGRERSPVAAVLADRVRRPVGFELEEEHLECGMELHAGHAAMRCPRTSRRILR